MCMPKARRFAHRRSRRARSNLAFHLAARSRSAFSMVSSSKLHGAWLLPFQDLKRTAECRSDCRKTEIWARRKSSEAGESNSDEAFPDTLETRSKVPPSSVGIAENRRGGCQFIRHTFPGLRYLKPRMFVGCARQHWVSHRM